MNTAPTRRPFARLTDSEKEKILKLYDENPNMTYEAIANEIGCSIAPVWKHIKKERPRA